MTAITLRPVEQSMAEASHDGSRYYLPADLANLLRADPNRRSAVRFASDGLSLAGHLYRPPGGGRTPGVVMCGPISSVKEQTLPHYAERLAAAGYTVLTFDSRSFGESEGSPRHHYDPNQVIADYSNAVGFLLTRDDVLPDRIAAVGVCMGGGYAVSLGALDKRVQTVVSVAGGYNIGGTFQRLMGTEGFAQYFRTINDLHQRQRETGEVQYVPTIAPALSDEIPVAVMPNAEAFSYYDRTSRDDAPNWLPNTMTAASLEPFYAYNAVAHAPLVAPTPLLIVHGTRTSSCYPNTRRPLMTRRSGAKSCIGSRRTTTSSCTIRIHTSRRPAPRSSSGLATPFRARPDRPRQTPAKDVARRCEHRCTRSLANGDAAKHARVADRRPAPGTRHPRSWRGSTRDISIWDSGDVILE